MNSGYDVSGGCGGDASSGGDSGSANSKDGVLEWVQFGRPAGDSSNDGKANVVVDGDAEVELEKSNILLMGPTGSAQHLFTKSCLNQQATAATKSTSFVQDLVHTTPLSLQRISLSVPIDLNESPMDTKENVQNREFIKAENIVRHSQKLQEDLEEVGMKIKQHEDRLSLLNKEKVKLEDSIIHLQVATGKSIFSSTSMFYNAEEEVHTQILQHENSAAGVLCQIKTRYGEHASLLTLTKDVLGILPMLGRVEDDNLSRLFSEYLGVETMLAIVCKNYEGVKAIEMYDKEGCINRSSGLHGLGTSIGRALDGRFLVICLESLRPYAGKFVVDDPQRKLDILNPRLPNGEHPSGFLGFAVNMINIDTVNLFCVTPSGFGLRETLFYNLFSRLQVYNTRVEMMQALPFITDGALSLDGGMIRSCGVYSMGNRKDINVRFLKPDRSAGLDEQVEIENQMKDAQYKKEKILEDINRERALLDMEKHTFSKKKIDFLQFLASSSSSYATQVQNAPSVHR